MGLWTDITATVNAQVEADLANKAKSIFLATISHEIRTPLNGVLGMARAMRFDELSREQRRRLDVVERSGEALLALLNDVLDPAGEPFDRVVVRHPGAVTVVPVHDDGTRAGDLPKVVLFVGKFPVGSAQALAIGCD